MRLLHAASRVDAAVDEPNLMSAAGLVPVLRLAVTAGLWRLVAERLRVPGSVGSNPAGKVATIVAGMVAGADCIDDLDVVRSGGMRRLFGSVYAPSTLGSFLRALSWGHVRQLESAARAFLAGLVAAAPLLPGADQVAYVDVDSLLRRVYGHAKAGAAHGHAKVGGYPVLLRGLSPLVATVCTPLAAPVVAATRLRGGNAGSARGAAGLVAEAIGVARTAGATGQLLVRADSAFCSTTVLAACRRAAACFSVDHPSGPCGPRRDREHPGGGVDSDPLPAGGLGRGRAVLDLRRRTRRDHPHHQRRHPAGADLPAGRAPHPGRHPARRD